MMTDRAELKAEGIETRMTAAAHHEAGHIVVAALRGLKLHPKGIVIDPLAEGIACYSKDPNGSDNLRTDIIVATFAGFYSEQQCRQQRGFCLREENWLAIGDGYEANGLLLQLAEETLIDGSATLTAENLKRQAMDLVLTNWAVIEALAAVVLSKGMEPMPQFSRNWSDEATARQLRGDEIVRILATCGIAAEVKHD